MKGPRAFQLAEALPFASANSDTASAAAIYHGFVRGSAWAIKRVVVANGAATRAYSRSSDAANVGTAYAAAWAGRAALTYTPEA